MKLGCISHIALDDGLVQILLITIRQIIAGEILGNDANLAAVDRIRHITDPVNLGKGLLGQVNLVQLGRGRIATRESLIRIGDGRHFGRLCKHLDRV